MMMTNPSRTIPAARRTSPTHDKKMFDVLAPAGNLGVVINTPNIGAPVSHSIKEDCPIAEWLSRGDNENVMVAVVVGTTL